MPTYSIVELEGAAYCSSSSSRSRSSSKLHCFSWKKLKFVFFFSYLFAVSLGDNLLLHFQHTRPCVLSGGWLGSIHPRARVGLKGIGLVSAAVVAFKFNYS